jgi:phage-related protein
MRKPHVPRRLMARYYRARNGREPVEDFVRKLTPTEQIAIYHQVDRINYLDEEHPHLAFPYSSQIEGELRELRCHYGRKLFRILYRRSEQMVLLLHILEKHGDAIPEADIRVAKARWSDFAQRMALPHPRVVPSPLGHRAPPRRK